jgi:hypothetical protein
LLRLFLWRLGARGPASRDPGHRLHGHG